MNLTTRRLIKVAKYLESNGLYREAANLKKIAQENEESNIHNSISLQVPMVDETTTVLQIPLDEDGETVGEGQVFIQMVIQEVEGGGQIIWQMPADAESDIEEEEEEEE